MKLSTRSKKVPPRVVLDTNIFISAIIYEGITGTLLDLFESNQIQIVISPQTELEIFAVLARFNANKTTIANFKALLEEKAVKVVPKQKTSICRDPDDNKFLETAWETEADYLITGDKDLLTLGQFKSTKIITPKEFLDLTI